MGSVFKQKSGKWGIRFDVPEGNKRNQKQIGGFQNKPEASKELKKIEADILNGEYFVQSDIFVSDYINIWINDYVTPNLAPKTQAFYNSLYNVHFKDYFSKIRLSDLRAYDIDTFYRHLRQSTNLSANSIHHCHKMLRAALNQAVKWDFIKNSPMIKVSAPKQDKPKSAYWEPDIIPDGIGLFKGDPLEWMVRIALLTGLRQGEICALHKDTIDFKHKTFQVLETAQRVTGKGVITKPPKTLDSMAALPMTDEVSQIFKERLREITENKKAMLKAGKPYCMKRDGYLAVWEDGRLFDPNFVSGHFRKIVKSQNILPTITFHDLRHSCASWLIHKGVDMKTIQLILRHSNYKVTSNTYSHISKNMQSEALNKLSLTAK